MLSSKRALQISSTLVASFEKFTFLRCLQASFNILHSLAVSLWPILSSSMIISCSQLNHFHRESYCGSLAQVLFLLIFVKKGDMRSKVGSKSSLYSLIHNNFLFLRKYSSWGQDAKQKSFTLYQQESALTSLSYNFVDRVGSIPILSSNYLSFTLSCFSERHSTRVFLVFLIAGIAWGQKWTQHPYFSRWSVWVENYTTLF